MVVVGPHCFGAGFAAVASDFVDESVLFVAGFAAIVFYYLDDVDLPEVVYCPPVGVVVVACFALPPRHFLQCCIGILRRISIISSVRSSSPSHSLPCIGS